MYNQYTEFSHMSAAKVDIYMPTYKPVESHLHEAIGSVLAQNERDWMLHINDQKTDVDTESMVRSYLDDPRIVFRTNARHPGIGANWNDCLRHGDAPVVQYMFQDDTWKPNYLATGLRILSRHEDVGMVSLGHKYEFEGDVPTENVYEELKSFLQWNVQEGHHDGREFLFWWLEHGLHPNVIGEPMFVMLRRSIMEQTGKFRQDMRQNLDSEYWARVLLHTNWYYKAGNYGTFRVHGASASMQNHLAGRGIFDRYRMMHTVVTLLPPDKRKEGKRLLKRHFTGMMEKFINRYGRKNVHIRASMTPEQFIAKHPWLIAKAVWGYIKSKSRRHKPLSK